MGGVNAVRRVLGSQVQSAEPEEPDLPSSADRNSSISESAQSYRCPICGDDMISLLQLNRHIDDEHQENSDNESASRGSASPKYSKQSNVQGKSPSTPQKRILKMDLYDNSSGFSLSENSLNAELGSYMKLTRAHWKRPSPGKTTVCSSDKCKNVLNVKNGIVNCRMCGELFCNKHTRYWARLSNCSTSTESHPQRPVYNSTSGILAKVCWDCYINKPAIRLGTQVNSRDLSEEFFSKRRRCVEEKQIDRSMLHKKYLRLVALLAKSYLWHIQHKNNLSIFGRLPEEEKYTKEYILEAQKEIVGIENWESDGNITHCRLCFAKFNFLIRKHHCRLCGAIVNDGSLKSDDPADMCSIQVPAGLFLVKLPHLNYPPVVRDNWDLLTSLSPTSSRFADLFSFRICKSCKNLLLHAENTTMKTEASDDSEILDAYDQILVLKSNIQTLMARYNLLVKENQESTNIQINKLRVKIGRLVKDLEISINEFLRRFFSKDAETNKLAPLQNPMLAKNIYKASTTFLQECLLELKQVNEKFQRSENEKLANQLQVKSGENFSTRPNSPTSILASPSPVPRLTKKEIRELRDQLMVINEQKFLIENMIEDMKKQRKFEELNTLEENKTELIRKIEELTEKLGEFGF